MLNMDRRNFVRLTGIIGAAAGIAVSVSACGDSGTTGTSTTGIGAFKTAMQALGVIESNAMAFPVRGFEGELVERVKAVMRGAGLLD